MTKRRMSKTEKWMVALTELSGRYGVALVEVYDGARIVDGKSGKELGSSLAYVCGLYTAHKPRIGKTKQSEPSQNARNIQGFVQELCELSNALEVRLELRSSPMVLIDTTTMQPVGRLQKSAEGYTVVEPQPA
ncbi:hypothetical protein [Alicyclobacillus ferrooxydans]|uniref:Uncharacterized protein n=1 Tax=Alicyclobacillus ferrooxydans TaxID=471514 RepID=A0A0N8PPW9_9BACL|nr:hypothetical protein [Alicyclobacillus ferrooxydans]KPV45493.1 hypothetical protein AN477_00585 [Alicyclobacillus ferrooxydans]